MAIGVFLIIVVVKVEMLPIIASPAACHSVVFNVGLAFRIIVSCGVIAAAVVAAVMSVFCLLCASVSTHANVVRTTEMKKNCCARLVAFQARASTNAKGTFPARFGQVRLYGVLALLKSGAVVSTATRGGDVCFYILARVVVLVG